MFLRIVGSAKCVNLVQQVVSKTVPRQEIDFFVLFFQTATGQLERGKSRLCYACTKSCFLGNQSSSDRDWVAENFAPRSNRPLLRLHGRHQHVVYIHGVHARCK